MLAGLTFSFEDNEPRVSLDSRRVGHAGGTKDHLTGVKGRRLLPAVRRQVDEVLHTAELQRDFIARIHMEIFSLFATAAEKRQGLGVLPENFTAFAVGFDALDDLLQVDRN